MTNEQREKIKNLRGAKLGYKKIAEQLGLSENTVKTYCRRHGLGGTIGLKKKKEGNTKTCLQCGTEIIQQPGRKEKKFCCDKCRSKWWGNHTELLNQKAIYKFECKYCKKPFTAYGDAKRKYCCHQCFVTDKYGIREEIV